MGVSAKKIELLKRKIIESRARIMRGYPSFGLLLMHLIALRILQMLKKVPVIHWLQMNMMDTNSHIGLWI